MKDFAFLDMPEVNHCLCPLLAQWKGEKYAKFRNPLVRRVCALRAAVRPLFYLKATARNDILRSDPTDGRAHLLCDSSRAKIKHS